MHLQFITPSPSALACDLPTSTSRSAPSHPPLANHTDFNKLRKRGVKDSGTFRPVIGLRCLYLCGSRFNPILLACVPTPCSSSPFGARPSHPGKVFRVCLSYQRGDLSKYRLLYLTPRLHACHSEHTFFFFPIRTTVPR